MQKTTTCLGMFSYGVFVTFPCSISRNFISYCITELKQLVSSPQMYCTKNTKEYSSLKSRVKLVDGVEKRTNRIRLA